MSAIEQLSQHAIPVSQACTALDLPRSSYYRDQQTAVAPLCFPPEPAALALEPVRKPAPTSPRALSESEKDAVRQLLHSPRFVDSSPYQVYGTLLDEGVYHCSIASMYRLLRHDGELRERRRQRSHPAYAKPELLAIAPNQLWTWDITKLRGPVKGHAFALYVLLDVFSRYVVGWLVAEREAAKLAEDLIAESCLKQAIQPDQLTIHSDRGGPMTAKSLAVLLTDLGVSQSHARPYTPNDNPFSEAQFKTLKYRPGYPDRFGCLADARAWAQAFFHWYNHHHRHTGLGLLTPTIVHHGQAEKHQQQRQQVLQATYAQHPERFINGQPVPPALPTAVWINPPKLLAKSDATEDVVL